MKIKTLATLVVVMAGLMLFTSGTSWSQSIGMEASGVVTPLLQYQGRLTDPTTGEIVADGAYAMNFQLYNVETGGTALWSESEAVQVQGGVFSTVLGDTNALVPSLFNGQALWLGVTVEGEQLGPRQPVLPVAYALSLVPGAIVEANRSPVLQVNNLGGGEALQVGGDLIVSGGLIGGSHAHSGGDITSGTVADARISASIARDSEIMPTVLASDGSGSTLDADLLDGLQSSDFLNASNLNAGTLSTNRYSAYSDLSAEGRIGAGTTQVAAGNHLHDSRYVNTTGDSMTGVLTVPGINYSPARTEVTSVIGEHFVSRDNQPFSNGGGMGGANQLSASSGCLVAGLQLPNGVTITQFRAYFYDNASNNLTVYLVRLSMTGGAYVFMANVVSAGAPEYSYLTDTSISVPIVDNTSYGYNVMACASPAWDGTYNLRIMGASITYIMSEAQ